MGLTTGGILVSAEGHVVGMSRVESGGGKKGIVSWLVDEQGVLYVRRVYEGCVWNFKAADNVYRPYSAVRPTLGIRMQRSTQRSIYIRLGQVRESQ